MMLQLIEPILKKTSQVEVLKPAPSIEVTAEAQDRYNKAVRAEMKKKVWEKNGGVSWYVADNGLCTVSCFSGGPAPKFERRANSASLRYSCRPCTLGRKSPFGGRRIG